MTMMKMVIEQYKVPEKDIYAAADSGYIKGNQRARPEKLKTFWLNKSNINSSHSYLLLSIYA